jgi:hypothetical protein
MLASMKRNRLAAVIALSACMGGCATTGGKVSAIVGTVAAVGAVATVATTDSCDANRDDAGGCFLTVVAVGGLGLVAAGALFVAMVFEAYGASRATTVPAQPPARVDAAPSPPAASTTAGTAAVAARDPRAELLTHQASLAARVGRCYTVGALGPQVQAIDPDYYNRVFATDPAIASCITDQGRRR